MRPIDADALKRGYQDICKGIACEECQIYFGGCKFERMIDDAPTIYPVKHGKWILVREADEDGNALYECSNCHKGEIHVPSVEVRYCWNCGARMDGE